MKGACELVLLIMVARWSFVLARLQPAGVSRYEVIEPRWSRGNGHVSLRDLDSSDFSDGLTLSFDAFEQKFQFNLRPNTDLFAPTYKELQMAEEGFIERGSKLHRACFLRSRPSNDSNFATINACAGDGGISGVIKAYEEEYRLEAISTDLRNFEGSVRSTIIYRTSDMTVNHEGHCGLNHYHHLEDVGVDETVSSIVRSVEESHVQRNQADEGCIKYVGILAINDFSRYQAKGNHVEEDTVEIMSYVKGRFNHQVVQWNCKIEIVLIGQLTFKENNPFGLTYRKCNTYDDYLRSLPTQSTDFLCCNDGLTTWARTCPYSYVECLDESASAQVAQPGCFSLSWFLQKSTNGKVRKIISVRQRSSSASFETDDQSLLRSMTPFFYNSRTKAELSRRYGNTYDVVHLLTNLNLAGNTVGLANLKSVCTTEGTSLSSVAGLDAFWSHQVVAHELGHNLGAEHDSGLGCPLNLNCITAVSNPPCTCPQCGYVMASSIFDFVPTKWTACSVSKVNQFFSNDYGNGAYGRCLEDQPVQPETHSVFPSDIRVKGGERRGVSARLDDNLPPQNGTTYENSQSVRLIPTVEGGSLLQAFFGFHLPSQIPSFLASSIRNFELQINFYNTNAKRIWAFTMYRFKQPDDNLQGWINIGWTSPYSAQEWHLVSLVGNAKEELVNIATYEYKGERYILSSLSELVSESGVMRLRIHTRKREGLANSSLYLDLIRLKITI